MGMTLNGMMKAERNAFLEESAPNKGDIVPLAWYGNDKRVA
ncbi:hypothetical protein [Natronogracilivirga saccharolytica]|nr:hypothetical protein [Natronogracilivirga saccharolytica]